MVISEWFPISPHRYVAIQCIHVSERIGIAIGQSLQDCNDWGMERCELIHSFIHSFKGLMQPLQDILLRSFPIPTPAVYKEHFADALCLWKVHAEWRKVISCVPNTEKARRCVFEVHAKRCNTKLVPATSLLCLGAVKKSPVYDH